MPLLISGGWRHLGDCSIHATLRMVMGGFSLWWILNGYCRSSWTLSLYFVIRVYFFTHEWTNRPICISVTGKRPYLDQWWLVESESCSTLSTTCLELWGPTQLCSYPFPSLKGSSVRVSRHRRTLCLIILLMDFSSITLEDLGVD